MIIRVKAPQKRDKKVRLTTEPSTSKPYVNKKWIAAYMKENGYKREKDPFLIEIKKIRMRYEAFLK